MDWSALPLTRAGVDRAAHRRSETGLVDTLRGDPATRVVVVQDGRLATTGVGPDVRLDLVPATELDRLPGPCSLWFFLGQDEPTGAVPAAPDGTKRAAYLAVVLADPGAADAGADLEGVAVDNPVGDLLRTRTWSPLRDVGALLDDRDAGLAVTAVALAAWHANNTRCPRCGEPTEVVLAGWVRRCPLDGTEHYPRTDPAVIVAVVDDDDRLLLGHAAQWPSGRFSTLAGYVEPGESAEHAVRREVAEESAIEVGDVAYRASQPWPFPGSLMLGYTARATTTQITADGVEVTEARWFTRAALAAGAEDGSVLLPMRFSIARSLIEDWYGSRLP